MGKVEEQRPLFTIAVLVCGVVGGLAVVITVVYLYRFCLKKRPPVTTTGKPEQKRDHIRSEVTSQCRPLPLLLEQVSKEQTADTFLDRESTFGSPTKLAQVFPLLPTDGGYIQRSVQDMRPSNQKNQSFLSVGEPPLRAHSAELLTVNQQQELRRSSCDVPRGTGRQLPSTEGLEKQYEERQRRMSTFARSDAVQKISYLPRKQNSSPLPENHRIYERGHAHSRSWNPEGYHPISSPQPRIEPPTNYQYYHTNEVYPEPMFIPTINEPPPCQYGAVREIHRQAKSFDDRGGNNSRRISTDRRTLSMAERRLQKQSTIQQPEYAILQNNVEAACQSLWAARDHLEQLHALGISDPSSASTSFDSNTDSQSTTTDIKRIEGDAERRRMKYKSLLVQRKFLSTAAVSSLDSTNSAESSPHEAIFASSVDSSKSDLEQRRLSLMNKHSGLSMQHFPGGGRSNDQPIREDPRRPITEERRRELSRDYSVDSKSDQLFREWSRVDPAYGSIEQSHGNDYQQPQRRQHVSSRQMSVGSPVLVPLINYSRDYN